MNHITPIAEETRKKSVRWVRDTDDRCLSDVYEMFAAPAGATGKVTLVRPFSVLSKSTYSAAILPPLGLAYLAHLRTCVVLPLVLVHHCTSSTTVTTVTVIPPRTRNVTTIWVITASIGSAPANNMPVIVPGSSTSPIIRIRSISGVNAVLIALAT